MMAIRIWLSAVQGACFELSGARNATEGSLFDWEEFLAFPGGSVPAFKSCPDMTAFKFVTLLGMNKTRPPQYAKVFGRNLLGWSVHLLAKCTKPNDICLMLRHVHVAVDNSHKTRVISAVHMKIVFLGYAIVQAAIDVLKDDTEGIIRTVHSTRWHSTAPSTEISTCH